MQGNIVRRDVSIDFIKTLAIFGVVMIHTSTAGYQMPLGSFEWLSSIFWGSVTRGSVPLFLMCSGALMLDPARELPLKRLFGKNILRLFTAMLVWALFYKCYFMWATGTFTLDGLWQSIKEVLIFRQESHLYYLQIALLFYVLLPVVRVFVRHAEKRQAEYALAVWFAVGILYPTVRPFWPFRLLGGIPAQWLLNMAYASVGYGLLGWYIKRYPLPKRAGWGMFLAGAAFTFGATWLMSLRRGALYTGFLEGMTIGPALLAAGLFTLGVQGPVPLPRACGFMSKASFCVYLVHICVKDRFTRAGLAVSLGPSLLTIPLLVACNVAVCCVVYLVLSRAPWVRKYLV